MLAKEKRLAIWSLAIGVGASAALFGAFNWRAHFANSQAQRLDAIPHSSPTPKTLSDKDFVPESDLPSSGHWVVDTPSDSDLLRAKATSERSDGQTFALLALAISVVPLIWYFLLDRLREISAAVSGRDKSN
jgi:hypothetical protein